MEQSSPPSLNRRTFLRQAGIFSLGFGLTPGISGIDREVWTPLPALPKISPEAAGIPSAALTRLLREAHKSGLEYHSFMLLRHGKRVAQAWWKPFDKGYIHTLYSLSKSFTSTAVGLAVKEGRIKVSDKVTSFFPEFLPAAVSENLAKMEIRHLLSMTTGHDTDTTPAIRDNPAAPWAKTFLAVPVEHEPGTHFLYNTGATYMCGAIATKVTGQSLTEYLRPRLFEPLGIAQADWEKNTEGLNLGGWGLRVTTEDIARLGQLYLQKGQWNGREILPAAWVEEATRYQVKSNPGTGDWSQGYGYQFWRCRHGFYRGDGAFGQYCIVMPQYDAVIAMTAESTDMQATMNLIWDILLPEMKDSPLPANAADKMVLDTLCDDLSIPAQPGGHHAAIQPAIAGKTYTLAENQWGWKTMALDFSRKGGRWRIRGDAGETVIPFHWGRWAVSHDRINNPFTVDYRTLVPSKVAASAGWGKDDVFQLRLKYVEAIHGDLLTLRFSGKEVELTFLNSLAEKDPVNTKESRAPLTGHLT